MNHDNDNMASIEEAIRELAADLGADGAGELIALFLDDAPSLVQAIKGAVAAKDADALTRAAHTLKSTAATVGASALSECAMAIEAGARGGSVDAAAKEVAMLDAHYAGVVNALAKVRSAIEAGEIA